MRGGAGQEDEGLDGQTKQYLVDQICQHKGQLNDELSSPPPCSPDRPHSTQAPPATVITRALPLSAFDAEARAVLPSVFVIS